MDAVVRHAGAIAGTLVLLWPVTLLVGGVWVAAAFRAARAPGPEPARLARWCLLPGVLTAAIMLVGAAFGGPNRSREVSSFPEALLVGLLLAHLPVGVVLARRAGERSPVVVASAVAWCWVAACAAAVAWMGVTDSWL